MCILLFALDADDADGDEEDDDGEDLAIPETHQLVLAAAWHNIKVD